jgi:hypothetical protein
MPSGEIVTNSSPRGGAIGFSTLPNPLSSAQGILSLLGMVPSILGDLSHYQPRSFCLLGDHIIKGGPQPSCLNPLQPSCPNPLTLFSEGIHVVEKWVKPRPCSWLATTATITVLLQMSLYDVIFTQHSPGYIPGCSSHKIGPLATFLVRWCS